MKEAISEILDLVSMRTHNLFATRQLLCSETVLTVLNSGFNGGLNQEMAVALSSVLPEGLGGSGCVCGALSGGSLAIGLFIGRRRPGIYNGNMARSAARDFHDRFKKRYGSTCCRVLTKNMKAAKRTRFSTCAIMTGETAALVAEIILDRQPKIVHQINWNYLKKRDSWMGSGLKKVAGTLT